MVLESLLSERLAERSLASDFFVGAALATAAIFTSYFLFPNFASILSVILISIGIVPLMIKAFGREEHLDELDAMNRHGKPWRFTMHRGPMKFFITFFVAIAIVVGAWQLLLPKEISSLVFMQQHVELEAITSSHFSLIEKLHNSGDALSRGKMLSVIVLNNLKIMLSTFALSLLFGGGAAFILSWNSVVLGVLLGRLIQQQGLASMAIFVYAIPEFFIYYIMGIAGGVLSVGVIKYVIDKRNRKAGRKILPFLFRDTLGIFVISLVVLFAAAFVEVLLIS